MASAGLPADLDPGVFTARLRDFEWRLFRGVMISRVVVVLVLGAILPDERSVHGSGLFVVILAAWAVAFVWVAIPLPRLRGAYDLVKSRPSLVWTDIGILCVLLSVGGGWRNPFYLYAWSPFGLASVVWSARRAAFVVAVGCGAQIVSFVLWHAAGADPAAREVQLGSWASPLLGYVIVGGLFVYVRRRFDDLDSAARGYRDRAFDAIAATRSAAASTAREEMAFILHRRLCQVFPALALRLAALADDAAKDPTLRARLSEISQMAARADAILDDAMRDLRPDEQLGTVGSSTFGTGSRSLTVRRLT